MAGTLSLSPYRIGIFRQCPRRYKLHYLDGLYQQYRRWWPFYTMGAHVHTALSRFLSPINRDRTLGRLERLLEESWVRQRKGFASPEEEKIYFGRARAQVRWFYAHDDPDARPYMVEAHHSLTLAAGFRLIGKVDRVDRDADGTLRVIDYKTSKSSAHADDFQLRAYALLLSRRYHAEVGEVGFLFLNGDGLIGHAPTAAELERTEAELFAARDAIVGETAFAPRPGNLCGWCDFHELCDAVPGEAAGLEGEEMDFLLPP